MSSAEGNGRPAGWLPLTNAQQLIWASQQLHPDAPLYNMAFIFEISGEVEPAAFTEAFRRLMDQCDALRTVLDSADGVPRQRVLDTLEFDLPIVDVGASPDPAAAAREWAQQQCEAPFRLDHRLFDAALLRLGAGHWAWYFNQHHLVTDAWSSAVIYERMESLYRSIRRGTEGPDGPLPPFAEYLPFERASAAEAGLSDGAGAAPGTSLSLYGRRARPAGTRNTRLTHQLSETQTEQLADLALAPKFRALTPDLTRFRLIATALFAYLHRVGGQPRLTIGAPAHNRATSEFRQSAGLFMEMFPLDVEIEPGETFASLHTKVAAAADAFIRSARPGGSTAQMNRTINAVLNVIRGEFSDFDGAPVHAEWLHPGHVDAEHHLRLQVHDFNATGRLTLLFDCSRDLLDEDLLPEVPEHFLRVFDAMLADVEQPIAEVDLLSADQRRAVLDAVNGTTLQGAGWASVVQRFENWVRADPGAVALADQARRWSYAELDAATSRIAAGISPGSVVGVCLGRSPEAVITMLGVLRAGAAYVPIDPGWPLSRIEYVVSDAGCSLLVSDRPLPIASVAFADLLASEPQAEPVRIADHDLAYVLYTSGSTGRPKGVMIEHGSLANYVSWASDFYDSGRRLSFPLFTPLTFDLTVTSVFVPLTSGGSIVVYPEAEGPADTAVQQVFEDGAVDIVKLTPSHLALLPDRDYSSSNIRQLILGGEDLTAAAARRVHDRFSGNLRIHNEYGPTEATVGCIVHTYEASQDGSGSVPIGTPIRNMRAYVLDEGGRPVPFGVPGELWLAGAGLARGYAGAPDLTADRFFGNTHVDEERLYRTGDLARVRTTGTIEYLGRQDDQVKVRGARLELGEVEAALATHPLITATAARVWERERPAAPEELVYCARCGLASDYPDVEFDAGRVCNHCRSFETYRDKAQVYFKPMAELAAVFQSDRPGPAPEYDCIALLSGGKDSTYALCRLVDMGLRVLAFTLDNGYISNDAKANIRRVVTALGVDHVFASTPAMNEIFVDSLQRHGNVCNGCFKTIYTLSLETAREKKIPFIVTGLSRGQFFETRLTEELFTELTVSSDQIDANVLEARKAYHQVDDAVHRLLDVSIFDGDAIFDDVQFVDFYRYCDVDLDELMAYLDERVPWVRPSDTGRSTNCRINDVGIYFHRQTRGFHNYSLPYSWDVRMGHKTREAALDELDDDIDVAEVQRILAEIGFPEDVADLETGRRLVAYYVAPEDISASELRLHVGEALPEQMVPSLFVRLDAIPLSANGKVDREALPEPGKGRPQVDSVFLAPRTEAEITLSTIWQDVLGIDGIGVRDSFFDLGGDSIMAIQIVARAHRAGLNITLQQLFNALTVERLAQSAGGVHQIAAERVVGPVGMTPIQRWFLEEHGNEGHFHQVLHLDVPEGLDRGLLAECLTALAGHHDALRQSFLLRDGEWVSEVAEASDAPELSVFEIPAVDDDTPAGAMESLERPFDVSRAPLLRAGLFRMPDGADRLTLVAHHLVVDSVSWTTIVDGLTHLYQQGRSGEDLHLPPVPASIRDWVDELTKRASSVDAAPWMAEDPEAAGPGRGPEAAASRETVSRQLDADATAALMAVTADGRARIEGILATALAMTLADDDGSPTQRLFVEGHGRDADTTSLDLSRTVGWLTSLYPVTISLPDTDDLAAVAASTGEQLIEAAATGRDYGVVRYLHPDPEVRAGTARDHGTHVVFNYLGRADAMAPGSSGFRPSQPVELSRPSDLPPVFAAEVSAVIDSGRLHLTWVSAGRGVEAMQRSLADMADRVTAIVQSLAAGRPAAEPDGAFPLANLDETGFAKLASVLKTADGE